MTSRIPHRAIGKKDVLAMPVRSHANPLMTGTITAQL
jgi:hypothetical protein